MVVSGVGESVRMKRSIHHKLVPYYFLIPLLAIVAPLLIYPIFRGIVMSFFDLKGLSPELKNFTGFGNYQYIFSNPRFLNSAITTVAYTIYCVVFTLLVGLFSATLLNARFPGRTAARVAMTLPWAIPEVACVMIWVFMFDPNFGVFNNILMNLGVINHYGKWLNDVNTAFPSVIATTIWKIFPFSTIVILTALQTVPTELYEVAKIDGANALSVYTRITLPLIRPTLMLLMLLNTIWSFKRFTIIWLSTQGGPSGTTENLVILMYKYIFQMFKPGLAAAVGVMGLLLTMVITVVYFVIQKKQEAY